MGRTCTGPAPRLRPWCRKLGQSSDRGVRWTDARTAAGEYRAEGLSASVPRAPTRGGWSHAIARPRTSRLRAARRAHHRQQFALSQPVGAGTVATISIGPAISMVGPDAPAERPPSGACLVCHVAVLTQPSLEKPRASIDARAAREQGERDHAAKERQGCLRDRGGHAGPCHRRELGWRQGARRSQDTCWKKPWIRGTTQQRSPTRRSSRPRRWWFQTNRCRSDDGPSWGDALALHRAPSRPPPAAGLSPTPPSSAARTQVPPALVSTFMFTWSVLVRSYVYEK